MVDTNEHSIDKRLPRELKRIGMVDAYEKNLTYLDQHLIQRVLNQ